MPKRETDFENRPLTPKVVSLVFACVTAAVLMVVFAYTTFATVSYVDQKHQSVMEVMTGMRDEIHDMRDKVYDLNGEKAPPLRKK